VSRLSQPTPSHIEEVLESAALAFTTVASIAVAFTVVQPCAAGWRLASELPQWEQLPLELMELIAADTIPIDPATKWLQARANTSAKFAAGGLDRQI
jgi:hypothetical protein